MILSFLLCLFLLLHNSFCAMQCTFTNSSGADSLLQLVLGSKEPDPSQWLRVLPGKQIEIPIEQSPCDKNCLLKLFIRNIRSTRTDMFIVPKPGDYTIAKDIEGLILIGQQGITISS